ESGVAPRRARRPAGKARRLRIPGVFEGGATQPPGMHRPSNAARLSPRAVRWTVRPAIVSHSSQTLETCLIRVPLSSGDRPHLSALKAQGSERFVAQPFRAARRPLAGLKSGA